MTRWAEVTGRPHVLVPHDDVTGTVDADAYRKYITPEVRVATIIQTSPVTGISVDVTAIAAAIREKSPECFMIVDGIQHASHGHIDLAAYDVDGYAVSPYKVFSRHGYGVGWASDRLTALTKEGVIGSPAHHLGTWHPRCRKLRHLLRCRGVFRLARRPPHQKQRPPRPC